MEWNRGPEPDWPDKVRNWNSWPEAPGQGAWGEADQADGEADGEVSLQFFCFHHCNPQFECLWYNHQSLLVSLLRLSSVTVIVINLDIESLLSSFNSHYDQSKESL